ncbi:MAG: tol-pal system protein YbgF [Gemmatimonadaceae bacterium]
MSAPPLARLLLPVVLLAASGCFATRSDMRILQGDILTMRHEAARADSARARQFALLAGQLVVVADSIRETGNRLTRYQGENRGEFRAMGQQLLQLGELVGQSSAVVQRMRAENEARMQQQLQHTPPPAGAVTDTTQAAAPTTQPVAPGPNQLFQDGLAQARRGSYGAAQAAFEEMLRLYPTSDLAPDAQYYLAESYESDGKLPQADSAYAALVAKFPRSPKASTALYKRALSLVKQGRRGEARTAMEQLTRQYPNTDAAELAAEWLRTNR